MGDFEKPRGHRSSVRCGMAAADRSPAGAGQRYARILMTTRRFCARPALVLFGATGFSEP